VQYVCLPLVQPFEHCHCLVPCYEPPASSLSIHPYLQTNAIESVNMCLRKITMNRGSFPSDEALSKLRYLALRNISQKWNMPIRDLSSRASRGKKRKFFADRQNLFAVLRLSPKACTVAKPLNAPC